jgi:hypothetical protein
MAETASYRAILITYTSGERYLMSPLHSADTLLLLEGSKLMASPIPDSVKRALKEAPQGSKGDVLVRYIKELLGGGHLDAIVSVRELEVDDGGLWDSNDVAPLGSDAVEVSKRYL